MRFAVLADKRTCVDDRQRRSGNNQEPVRDAQRGAFRGSGHAALKRTPNVAPSTFRAAYAAPAGAAVPCRLSLPPRIVTRNGGAREMCAGRFSGTYRAPPGKEPRKGVLELDQLRGSIPIRPRPACREGSTYAAAFCGSGAACSGACSGGGATPKRVSAMRSPSTLTKLTFSNRPFSMTPTSPFLWCSPSF